MIFQPCPRDPWALMGEGFDLKGSNPKGQDCVESPLPLAPSHQGRDNSGHDLVSHVIRFCRSLREHGLLVGPSETADAARSLGLVDLLDRDQVYWAFRTVLVSRADEISVFDGCFRRFWSFQLPIHRPPFRDEAIQVKGISAPCVHGGTAADGEDSERAHPEMVHVIRTGASPVEVVARRDLTVFQGNYLPQMFEIASRIIRALPSRPGRRLRRHLHKGSPDLRSAFRLNLVHGGDLITIPRRRQVPRMPRLLVLLDVSGSMNRHADLLLQLVYALANRSGRVETFVFSTSLIRVTRQLRSPTFSLAVRRIGDLVSNWSGGTRIGQCLETLTTEYAHILDRSTSVLLHSDGWETGDPDRLGVEVARLRKRVRRLVWLNPLMGTPDYAPLTLGLQAASPHVDLFASALDLAQLKRLPGLLGRNGPPAYPGPPAVGQIV